MTARHALLAGMLAIGATGAALAQDTSADAPPKESAADRVIRSFTDCRAIAAPDLRLQCFDKAASTLEASIKSKEVRVIDRSDVRRTRRSLFGFVLPSVKLFGGDEKDDEEAFTEINSTVASAREVANGRVEIRLADESGAVWQTTDPMDFPPRPGTKIRIRKGAMGNYFLSIGGGKSYRGMRLR